MVGPNRPQSGRRGGRVWTKDPSENGGRVWTKDPSENCHECVCMSLCLSARERISKTRRSKFNKFSMHVACGRQWSYYRRRPGLPSRRTRRLEQSAGQCDFCSASENISLPGLVP